MVILSTWCFDPSHVTCVLVGFNRSRLALIHVAMTSRQSANLLTAVGASLTDVVSVDLAVVRILMQSEAMHRHYLAELGGIEDEQQGTEDGPLWNAKFNRRCC